MQENNYSILASVIAGRKVAVHFAKQKSDFAYCDGLAIFLPSQIRDSDIDWHTVVAQACLLRLGSLQSSILIKLFGRPVAMRRYVFFEVQRACVILKDELPRSFVGYFRQYMVSAASSSNVESMRLALSMKSMKKLPSYIGTVRPIAIMRKPRSLSVSTDTNVSGASIRSRNGDSSPEFSQNEDEENAYEELFGKPVANTSNPFADWFNAMIGVKLGAGNSFEVSDTAHSGAEWSDSVISNAKRDLLRLISHLPIPAFEVDTTAESIKLRYSEWDYIKNGYAKDQAVVEEVEAWLPTGARDLKGLLSSPSTAWRRQLSHLGLRQQMCRRQSDGADLDHQRLLDIAIDLKLGYSPPVLDVYRATRRTKRALGVAIAVDISGSTADINNGRSVFDSQIQAAYRLCQTFSLLGDSVTMFGFHSWGRNLIRAVRIKGAEEQWNGRVSERLGMLAPGGFTRTGTAIRHATRQLHEDICQPNSLFILITDGLAYDRDYDHKFAQEDTGKALEEAKAKGVACVCLCVGGSDDSDKLKQIFGAANLLAVDQPEQLLPHIGELCATALSKVGAH